MKKLSITLLILGFLFSISILNAQHCVFDEVQEEIFIPKDHYDSILYWENIERIEEQVLEIIHTRQIPIGARSTTEYNIDEFVIPVAVHILHQGEPIGTGLNISNQQVLSQIAALNRDFNFDSSATGVQTKIRFCLAENPWPNDGSIIWADSNYKGIMRYDVSPSELDAMDLLYHNRNLSEIQKLDNLIHPTSSVFPSDKYLNIYVVEDIEGGPSGYASPAESPTSFLDGVVIDYNFFGDNQNTNFCPSMNCFDLYSPKYQTGKVLSHEVGHFLGLLHTFQENGLGTTDPGGSDDCELNGDRVCDTPPCIRPPSTGSFCAGDIENSINENITYSNYPPVPFMTFNNPPLNTDANDLIENHMYYSTDDCRFTFTNGQAERMYGFLFVSRSNLHHIVNLSDVGIAKPAGCVEPKLIADFTHSGNCLNDTIYFNTPSGDGLKAIQWEWDLFNDGTIDGNGTSFNHVFTTNGIFDLKLTAYDDSMNSVSFIKNLYIGNCEINDLTQANWYFGKYAGMTFLSGEAKYENSAEINQTINSVETAITVNDRTTGALLFYCDGVYIWDNKHNKVNPNIPLPGDNSSRQIIWTTVPDEPDNYMVFISPAQNTGVFKLGYAKIHATVDNITIEDYGFINDGFKYNEGITAIPHRNGSDYWIICTGYGTDNQKILVYRYSKYGLTNKDFSSNSPDVYNTVLPIQYGIVKGSPDNTKLALSHGYNVQPGLTAFDFNNATGVLSNETVLSNGGPYGNCSFSPNSQYIYTSNTGAGASLYRYSFIDNNFVKVGDQIGSCYISIGRGMQLGPDNKLYTTGDNNNMTVINNPNENNVSLLNIDCGKIELNAISSIANFIDGKLDNPVDTLGFTFAYENCYSVNFQLDEVWIYHDIEWDFGDGTKITGKGSDFFGGFSFLTPKHTYSVGGTYNVKLTVSINGTDSQTLTKKITILDSTTTLDILGNNLVCENEIYDYTVDGDPNIEYDWVINGGTFVSGSSTSTGINVEVFWSNTPVDLTVTAINPDSSCSNITFSEPITLNTVSSSPTITSAVDTVCISDTSVQLSALPTGGNWAGPGVFSNGLFVPEYAGLGSHIIIYSVASCDTVYTDSIFITVTGDGIVFTAPNEFCLGDSQDTLAVMPPGGVWSGDGIVNDTIGIFDPDSANSGINLIGYTYINANGCLSNETFEIKVNGVPEMDSTKTIFCFNDDAVQIETIPNDSNGIWSGPGIINNKFNPFDAGLGNHILTYTYDYGNGCIKSSQLTVQVLGKPILPIPSMSFCSSDPVQNITYTQNNSIVFGDGIGGAYSNAPSSSGYASVIDNRIRFYPQEVEVGNHTMTIRDIDTNGCITYDSTIFTVTEPEITFSIYTYCSDDGVDTLNASPSSGFWTVDGIGSYIDSSGVFNPSQEGYGVYPVAYTYTDTNGCTNTEGTNVIVYEPQLILSINHDDGTGNGSITVNAYGVFPFSYSWSHDPLETSNAISGLSGGFTTTVTVIDGNNCVTTKTITIYEIYAGADRNCPGRIGPTNVSDDLAYEWLISSEQEFTDDTKLYDLINNPANPYANPMRPVRYLLRIYRKSDGALIGSDFVNVNVVYAYDDVILTNNNNVISTSTSVRGKIVVPNGKILTIKNAIVEFGPRLFIEETPDLGIAEYGIVVEDGARLTLDNAVLKTKSGCEDEYLWAGVQVWGYPQQPDLITRGTDQVLQHGGEKVLEHLPIIRLPRLPDLFKTVPDSKHGKIVMNNSTIQDAHVGVSLDRSPKPLGGSTNYGGAIIEAQNSRFLNNKTGVYFGESKYHTNSYIQLCTLEANKPINNGDIPYYNPINDGIRAFVELNNIRGPEIIDNSFSVSNGLPLGERGTGILAFKSTYEVIRKRPEFSYIKVIGQEPPIVGDGNQFDGLFKGIDNYGGVAANVVTIKDCRFTNTHQAITLNGSNFDDVSRNLIVVPQGNMTYRSWGIYTYATSEYDVQENKIDAPAVSNPFTYGVVSRNSRGLASNIYRNELVDNMHVATQTEENNGNLQIDCNEYNGTNTYDMAITSGSLAPQGNCNEEGSGISDPELPTFNEFHGNCTGFSHIYNDSGTTLNYNSNVNSPPTCYSILINKVDCDGAENTGITKEEACPSRIGTNVFGFNTSTGGGNGGGANSLSLSTHDQLSHENSLIREYFREGNYDAGLDILVRRGGYEAMQILAATYSNAGYLEHSQMLLDQIPVDNETANFHALMALSNEVMADKGSLMAMNAGEIGQLHQIENEQDKPGVASQGLLTQLEGMEYVRVPEPITGMMQKSLPGGDEDEVSNTMQQAKKADLNVSLADEPQAKQLEIYPNPFNSSTQIRFFTEEKGSVAIVNSLGSLVKTIEAANGNNLITIDHSELNGNGVYYVIVLDGNKIAYKEKLVLMK